jgi:transposase-like protein
MWTRPEPDHDLPAAALPHSDCPSFKLGAPFPWRRCGYFARGCDGRLVARFRCLTCGRSFSTQTFRVDYRLRKPRLQHQVLIHFVSKVTLRQSARTLGVTRKTVEHRLRLLGKHLELFHQARMAGKPLEGIFQLDEAETFETDRRLRPVTVPVLIERKWRFIVHAETGPLPARGKLSPRLLAKKVELEKVEGKRRSGSRRAVTKCFEALREHRRPDRPIFLQTDRKATYPAILKEVFEKTPVLHERTTSKAKRDRRNPLFSINHTLAMLRDGLSRLVRRTWAHAKLRKRLATHLWIYIAWRNYIRGVSNKLRHTTPAMAMGVETERWSREALLRWSARFPELLRPQ